jgi:hypothetical protein
MIAACPQSRVTSIAWKLPRRLERLVPRIDIEGEQLAKSLQPSPAHA